MFENDWTKISVIVISFAVGAYFNNKRIDDFKDSTNKRFEDLYKYLEIRFKHIDDDMKLMRDDLKELKTDMKELLKVKN